MRNPLLLYIILCWCFATSLPVDGSTFTPYSKNYSKSDYQAASQNWAVCQNSEHILYVGNHNGLLEFDGNNWVLYKLHNEASVRSIYADKNDRIYAGSSEEFGFFERNKYGSLDYTSLSDTLKNNDLKNKLIWSIVEIGGRIYFQTFAGYFEYDGQNVSYHKTPFQLFPFYQIGTTVYTSRKGELVEFDGKEFITKAVSHPHIHFKAISRYGEQSILAISESDGIWEYADNRFSKWNTDIDKELNWAIPNRLAIANDSLILIGTVLNGLYAIDRGGKLVWHINASTGLFNNTILGIHCTEEQNIWLALDDGISMINNSGYIEVASWNNKNVGSIFDVEEFAGETYISTNQGLYTLSDKEGYKSMIKLVSNTEGYIVNLYKADTDNLFIGHSKKTLVLNKSQQLSSIHPTGGGMCIRPITIDDKAYIIQSSYTLFDVFEVDEQRRWKFRNSIKNFSNPIKYFEVDENGIIWAGHLNKGLHKIRVDKEFMKVVTSTYINTLDSTKYASIGVFKLKNRIIFTDSKQCYTYDNLNDTIVPYKYLNDNIGHFAKAHKITKVDESNYWFITDQNAALVNLNGDKPLIINTIEYSNYGFKTLDDFENIISIANNYSILCFQNGIAKIKNQHQAPAITRKLKLAWATAYDFNKGTQLTLDINPEEGCEVANNHNSMSFGISFPEFGQTYKYRYRLKGLNDDYTFAQKGEIEFVRIPSGDYVLEIEALSGEGKVAAALRYPLLIKPPIYASPGAYIFYALLVMMLAGAIYYYAQRRQKRVDKRLRAKQEKEIIKLENEKLSGENTHKSKELASYAMNMIRQTEILKSLRTELDVQKEQLGAQYPNKYYNKLIAIIDENLSTSQEWEIFQTNFDRIHENFFRNLRKQYSDLSSSDLKLCALLRLNLDTKGIADLMNIAVRGVEGRRYRLRKKLNLDSNDNLTEFLIDFK